VGILGNHVIVTCPSLEGKNNECWTEGVGDDEIDSCKIPNP